MGQFVPDPNLTLTFVSESGYLARTIGVEVVQASAKFRLPGGRRFDFQGWCVGWQHSWNR